MLIRSAVFLAICRISKPTEIQNILGGILLFKYLKKINFREINFTGISFCGCKFWHIYLEFIFADGEILIISRGFSFVIARYLIFTSSKTITAWKVSVFGVILVRIFPHSDWIGRDTSISPYLVRMRGNTDQNNSEYRHFLRKWIEGKKQNVAKLQKCEDVLIQYYSHS